MHGPGFARRRLLIAAPADALGAELRVVPRTPEARRKMRERRRLPPTGLSNLMSVTIARVAARIAHMEEDDPVLGV